MGIEFLKLFGVTVGFCLALMTAVWALSRKIHNAGVIDIAWSIGFAPLAIFLCGLRIGKLDAEMGDRGDGEFLEFAPGGACAGARVAAASQGDGRYEELRREWGTKWEVKIFGMFEFQAILIAVLAVPFLIVCLNPQPGLSVLEYTGMGLWLVAVSGESLADHQLAAFKAIPANKGKVCQAGLWHYSRHPNYFFEWTVWIAYFVFALGSPWGWASVYCPALMLFFLIKVTGIPMTEQLSVKNRGEQYREYQRTTSMFVPWPRKKTK